MGRGRGTLPKKIQGGWLKDRNPNPINKQLDATPHIQIAFQENAIFKSTYENGQRKKKNSSLFKEGH